MPLTIIEAGNLKLGYPSAYPPTTQPSSIQKIRWFPSLPQDLDFSGYKNTHFYLCINLHAETSTLL